ncbi:MAG: hypothetical protein C0473_03340 [Cyanobacteria bacterium DS3.002]|nr:hypothetical protein [Cyanobacteria bacterium DS3.002]MBA4049902.1 hypothetical protein [Cyanobacteria bacterium DS2.008]
MSDKQAGHSKQTAKGKESTAHHVAKEVHHAPAKGHVESWKESGLKLLGQLSHKAKEGLKIISGSHSGTICDRSKTKDVHSTAGKSGDRGAGDKSSKARESGGEHVKHPEPVLHRDKVGRVHEVVARNGNKFEVAYKPGSGHEVASVTIKDGKTGRPIIGEQPNQSVSYKVNQQTGEVTTAFRDSVNTKDSAGKLTTVPIAIEAHFTPDGTSAVIRRDLSGRRIDKTVNGIAGEKLAVLNYHYHRDQHGKDAGVTVDQHDHKERLTHRVRFATADDVEQQKAVERKDWRYTKRNGKERETCDQYDLRSGKDERVSHFEKNRDLVHGVTDVLEQKFRHGREYEVKQSQFDRDGKPVKLHYLNHDSHIDAKFGFDKNGRPCDVVGHVGSESAKEHKSALLQIAQVEIAITRNHSHVREINAEEILANNRPTPARAGEKACGVVAWKDGDHYLQGKVKDGKVLGADGKQIGQVSDNGDVTIGDTKFNILKDSKYAAVFHGAGTDGTRLDLCATAGKSGQSQELNGFLTNGTKKIQSVGSNLFMDGKFWGHLNKDGTVDFAASLDQKEHSGTHISKALSGDWRFVGNDGGKERQFNLSNSSNGHISLAQIDSQGKLKLGADSKPLEPIEYDVEMGMLIDRKSGKQIGKISQPHATNSKNLTDAEVTLFSEDPDQPPSSRNLSSFRLSTFKLTQAGGGPTVSGAVVGPPELQADGTVRPGTGGIVDIDWVMKQSDQNFKGKVVEAKAGLDREAAVANGVDLYIHSTPLAAPLSSIKDLAGAAVNQRLANDSQTDAAMAAMQLARKQNRDDHAAIEKMLVSGKIDADALARINHLADFNQTADISSAMRARMKADNPDHILESVPAKANIVVKIPDRQNPGKQIELHGSDGILRDAKSGLATGHYDAATGALVLLDAAGRPLSRSMADRQFAGATINLRYQDAAGKPSKAVWVNDGTEHLQSLDQLRKQVATELAVAKLLVKESDSDEASQRLKRTSDLARRYNPMLEGVEQNGVTDLTNPQDRFSILEQIKGGPKVYVRAESERLSSHHETAKSSLPKFSTAEDCQKATGPMRLGHEHYFVDSGKVYRTKRVGENWEKVGAPCGTLEPGYVLNLDNHKVPLAGKEQVLFQFSLGKEGPLYRVIGFGEQRQDSSGSPLPSGLIEVGDLRKKAAQAEQSADGALKEYRDSVGDVLSLYHTTRGLPDYIMGGREAQLELAKGSVANQSRQINNSIDNVFLKGLSGADLTSAELSQQVHTVRKFVKDVGLTTVDAKQLSADGISLQRQSDDALATAVMSFVPGGAVRLGAYLNMGKLGTTGLAAIGGGVVSTTFRQARGTTGEEALNNFAGGSFEALSMLVGAKAPEAMKALRVNPESVKVLERYLGPKAQALLVQAGDVGLQGSARFAKAGLETSGFAMAGAVRTGDYHELSPDKLFYGTLFMLAGQGAEKLVSNDLTKLGKKYGLSSQALGEAEGFVEAALVPKSNFGLAREKFLQGVDSYVEGFSSGIINNMTNAALVAKAQAVEEEKQRIADKHGIDRSQVSEGLFEQEKDQSRIWAYQFRSAAESGVTNIFTHPVSSHLSKLVEPHTVAAEVSVQVTEEHGRVSRLASENGQVEFRYGQSESRHFVNEVVQTEGNLVKAHWKSEDGLHWVDSQTGAKFEGRCQPSRSGGVLLENSQGRTQFTPDGTIKHEAASGGQFVKKDGLVVQVNDAIGCGTQIQYDHNSKPKALIVANNEGVEHLVRTDEGWRLTKEGSSVPSVLLKGEVSVTTDGKVVFSDLDGKHHIRHLDGRKETISTGYEEPAAVPNRPLELRAGPDATLVARSANGYERIVSAHDTASIEAFSRLVSTDVKDSTLQRHISEGMYQFTERIIFSGVANAELAKTLDHVNRLMRDTAGDTTLTAAERNYRHAVVSDFLLLAAHPTYLSQEGRSTCLPSSAVVRLISKHPSEAARILSDALIDGKCYLLDGTSIPITPSGLPGDRAAAPSLEMLEKALIGASHYDATEFAGVSMPKGTICYHDDQLCDSRTDPPTALPMRVGDKDTIGPKIHPSQLAEGWKRIIAAKDDFVILSDRYGDSANLPPGNVFDSPEALCHRLVNMMHDKEGPLAIQVNCGSEPFLSDLGGVANSSEHMVTIHKVEFDTEHLAQQKFGDVYDSRGIPRVIDPEKVWVTLDNTWDKTSDNPLRKIKLSELYLAASCPTPEEKLTFLAEQSMRYPHDLAKRLDLTHYVYEEMSLHQPDEQQRRPVLEQVKRLLAEKEAAIAARAKLIGLKVTSIDEVAFVEERKFLQKARHMLSRIEQGLPLSQLPQNSTATPASKSSIHNIETAEPGTAKRPSVDNLEELLFPKREVSLEDLSRRDHLSAMSEHLRELAFTHLVTKAPNHLALTHDLYKHNELKEKVAVFMIDAVNFGVINKRHGKSNGDEALKALSEAMTYVLKQHSIKFKFYHVGGDEFAVIVKDLDRAEEAMRLIQSVRITIEATKRPKGRHDDYVEIVEKPKIGSIFMTAEQVQNKEREYSAHKKLTTEQGAEELRPWPNEREVLKVVIGDKDKDKALLIRTTNVATIAEEQSERVNKAREQSEANKAANIIKKEEAEKKGSSVDDLDLKSEGNTVVFRDDLIVSPAIGGVLSRENESPAETIKRADRVSEHNKQLFKQNLESSVYLPAESSVSFDPHKDVGEKGLGAKAKKVQETDPIQVLQLQLDALYKRSLSAMTEGEMKQFFSEAERVRDAYLSLTKLTRHAGLPASVLTIATVNERIQSALAEKQSTKNLSLVKLAVDNFKKVNDHEELGHDVGDLLLRHHGNFVRDISAKYNIEVEIGTHDDDAVLITKNRRDAEKLSEILQNVFFVVSEDKVRFVDSSAAPFDRKKEVMVGYSVGVSHLKENDTSEKLFARLNESLDENKAEREATGLRLPRVAGDNWKARTPEQAALSRERKAEAAIESKQHQNLDSLRLAKSGSLSDLANLPENGLNILIEKHLGLRGDPFLTEEAMRSFLDCIETRRESWLSNSSGAFDQAGLMKRRYELEEDVNSLSAKIGAPKIEIELVPDNSLEDSVKMSYSLARGKIRIFERDLLDPRLLQSHILYHELFHAAQDATMLRGAAVTVFRRTGAAKIDAVAAEYSRQTGLSLPRPEERIFIARVLNESMPYVEKTAALTDSELMRDPEYSRALILSDAIKNPRKVSFAKVSAQLSELGDGTPFSVEPLSFLREVSCDAEKQQRVFGYKLLDPKYETRDKQVLAQFASPEEACKLLFGNRNDLARHLPPDLVPVNEKVFARLQLKALLQVAEGSTEAGRQQLSRSLTPQLQKLLVDTVEQAAIQSRRLEVKEYLDKTIELPANLLGHLARRLERPQVPLAREATPPVRGYASELVDILFGNLPAGDTTGGSLFLSRDLPGLDNYSDYMADLFRTVHENSELDPESVSQILGPQTAEVRGTANETSLGGEKIEEDRRRGSVRQQDNSASQLRDLTNLEQEARSPEADSTQLRQDSLETAQAQHRYYEAMRILKRNGHLRIE